MARPKSVSLFTNNRYDPLTECWNWTACRNAHGYGTIRYGGKTELVTRVAMHIWRGFDLSSKLFVCHKCDNPACFNPKHLFVGTQKDNISDSRRKGRHFLASRTHCSKGHPYSGVNLYLIPSPKSGTSRVCRVCARERARLYMQKRRETQPDAVRETRRRYEQKRSEAPRKEEA